MTKKKLLVVTAVQFGYHTDTYKYCQYLANTFVITFLCLDQGFPRLECDGVDVRYVPRAPRLAERKYTFIQAVITECRKDYDRTFICYFRGISILRLAGRSDILTIDIRTLSVKRNRFRRAIEDRLLAWEVSLFP